MHEERERQDAQWGGAEHDDKHSLFNWITILRTEVAEARAAITFRLPEDRDERSITEFFEKSADAFEAELVDIAAVCMAAYEAIQRRKGLVS